jgi:hypothetical protein
MTTIKITRNIPAKTTFKDIPASDLFVKNGRLCCKVTSHSFVYVGNLPNSDLESVHEISKETASWDTVVEKVLSVAILAESTG